MSYRTGWIAVSTLVTLATLAGCGGSDGPTGTLTMKVTYQGASLPEESVVLIEGMGVAATATLNESGDYEVQTGSGGLRNLPVGDYVVAVSPPAPKPLSSEEKEKYMKAGKPVPAPADTAVGFAVPKKFHNTTKSPLRVTVVEGGNDATVSF